MTANGDQSFTAAVAAHRAGDLARAEALYAEVLRNQPGHAGAAHNLGRLYLSSGSAEQALPLLAHAARTEGGRAQNWFSYIEALAAVGRFEDADAVLAACRGRGLPGADGLEAKILRPWSARLLAERRAGEAHDRLARLAALAPGDAQALADLGLALTLLRRWPDAEASYRAALAIAPDNPHALGNLASLYRQMGRDAEAETHYRQVLALDPANGAALKNLGALLKDLGRIDEAKACYRQALAGEPDIGVATAAFLSLAPVAASSDDIAEQRRGYAEGLEALAAWPGELGYSPATAQVPWFGLAYHGQDDRALVERTGEVLAQKVRGLAYVSPRVAAWRAPQDRPIRVAFVSEFLRDHTIGRLNRGFVEHLDRGRFEVSLLHAAGTRRDGFRAELDRMADAAIELEPSLEQQRAQIEMLAPDVLYFPDIGMSPQTYFLAHSRLAPVQAVSWGHPETTGLGTIDYFVSSGRIERADAEADFRERLVRLEALNTCYAAPEPPAPKGRAALGLPEHGVLYGCLQTLFKLHPDFDAVLAQIAAGDPDGRIVMLEPQARSWRTALEARWARTHPRLLESVLFLPRLSREDFLRLSDSVDVLLETWPFGGGNTFYEAMAFGTPTVVTPGRFTRGRIVPGAYAQMGVAGAPVVERLEDYAAAALALGRDPARRAALKAQLRAAAAERLFGDLGAVRQLESFLEAAVAAAGRGERLPADWRAVES